MSRPSSLYAAITIGCAGFLASVLWFDLMFDMQVIPYLDQGAVPEQQLASIRAYYQRVTLDASPMGHLVGFIMLVGIIANLARLVRSGEPLWLRVVSLLLITAPATWALVSIVPAAQALALASISVMEQQRLVIYIFEAHVVCLVLIGSLLALQFYSLWSRAPSAD